MLLRDLTLVAVKAPVFGTAEPIGPGVAQVSEVHISARFPPEPEAPRFELWGSSSAARVWSRKLSGSTLDRLAGAEALASSLVKDSLERVPVVVVLLKSLI